MKQFITILLLLTALSISAQQISEPTIVRHHYFDKLPSASGVEMFQGNVYLVADDLPYLFELDTNWQVKNRYAVSANTPIVNGRTPKNIKADFESMSLINQGGETFMLILSSGSKRTKRDTAFLVSMKTKKVVAKKDLRPWFEKIKNKSEMNSNDEINIEGVAVSNNKIYVAHRGNVSGNFIAASSLSSFMNYLLKKSEVTPDVKVYKFILPSKDGVMAGLSGMCKLPGEKGLLVTASLETTKDVVNDGAVLGSYLGFIPFNGIEKGIINLTPINDGEGKMIQKKQEGVVNIYVDKTGVYRAITVCDNDDGSSDIFEMKFKIK